jgi:hypothetical protein
LVVAAWAVPSCGAATDSAADTTTTTTTTTTRPATTTTTEATTTTTTEATTTTAAPPTTSNPFAGPPVWDPFEPLGPEEGFAALTGLPPGDDLLASRPILAVKIDNHPRSRPPTALDLADVVFEENVEQLTRFIALFHTHQPATVGPVRSARTSDLPVLAGLNRPILAWSGGNPYLSRAVSNADDAGVLVEQGHSTQPRCYRRDRARSAPHNLYIDPACLREASPAAGPARALWTFGPLPEAMAGQPVTEFGVAMDGVAVGWSWDPGSGRYLRSQGGRPHTVASGPQLGAANVVVMTVAYVPSPADHRSPEAVTVGSGPVVVHRGGLAIAGTWERPHAFAPYRFTDATGTVIPLAPGVTFVELARG